MSTLLSLAADYIERMANPTFGIATNEDYAIRFGKLLETEGFLSQLREEIESLKDPDVLSSHGWLWLFDWARSTGAKLDQELLFQLFDEWTSTFIKAEIVQLATRGYGEKTKGSPKQNLFDFPNQFLRRIMVEVTAPNQNDNMEREHSWGTPANSVLVAFLQANSPIALDAASVLLRHQWKGQRELINFFWALIETLDSETQANWRERLNPPMKFDNDF